MGYNQTTGSTNRTKGRWIMRKKYGCFTWKNKRYLDIDVLDDIVLRKM